MKTDEQFAQMVKRPILTDERLDKLIEPMDRYVLACESCAWYSDVMFREVDMKEAVTYLAKTTKAKDAIWLGRYTDECAGQERTICFLFSGKIEAVMERLSALPSAREYLKKRDDGYRGMIAWDAFCEMCSEDEE